MNSLSDRYDRLTRAFHWLTAAVVIFMFASAHVWENLAKGTPLRKGLQSVHISLGIAMALLIAARLLWRLFGGKRLKADSHPALNLLAKMAHGCLYLLLLAQIALGFLFRWAQGEPFNFFGLFSVPAPLGVDHEWRGTLGDLHNDVAWAIIVLAGLHAGAALWHHCVMRDGTLRRMLPRPRSAWQK
ncbi:cytochrome b [Pseudomonas lurida]|jgi:cytochrome b561|uniref:cytochrome b n=1 Tax=Pseudomonas lurida TaxID=244566 RepID=UPI00054BB6AA|nr:cytochrome b [Pseudomonas lurida]MBC3242622.1 cytochrome b [Pseudomonas lurida]MBD8667607.1 cytochrome b [Pseudomonas lurida]UZQ75984.1 cytochrome b [Pseudomonas lurida]